MSFSRREAVVVILLACAALVGGIIRYWQDYYTPVSRLLPANSAAVHEQDGVPVIVHVSALPSADAGSLRTGSGKINLNTATRGELESLPGIGPVLAKRIVEYRRQNGPFRTVEELQSVSGIGPSRYAAVRDLVTVD